MKQRKISTNFFLNILRVASATLIGIVMMPYVNRILGADKIGSIEYINTIINYFVMFSALGIPIYGIREIAKKRDNEKEKIRVLTELLLILFITTFIGYIVLFILFYNTNLFVGYQDLLFVFGVLILMTNLGAEWFFQGEEDQLYITIRYVIIRLITIALLFLFVRSKDDYLIYALIVVLNLCGSNFFNFFVLSKRIIKNKIKFNELDIKRHFKPILTIFIAAISINIYLQLDNFLIGFISGNKYLGYYAVANKLLRYSITFITIIGTVLMPRLSYLWENDKTQYNEFLNLSLKILLLISIPCSFFFLIFSKNIIQIFGGNEFYPALLTLKILSPLCIIVSVAYFIGNLILVPQGKEKIYTIAVSTSAIFSVMINWIVIKYFQQNGAAVVQTVSEILAIIIMIYFVRKKVKLHIFDKSFVSIILLFSILSVLFLVMVNYYNPVSITSFLTLTSLYFIMIFGVLIIKKDNTVTLLLDIIRNKIKL